MERKYTTTHLGVAAYLVSQGYEIERTEKKPNREGNMRTFIEFNVDAETGRQVGNDFFEGAANGNFKEFYESLSKVKQHIYNGQR